MKEEKERRVYLGVKAASAAAVRRTIIKGQPVSQDCAPETDIIPIALRESRKKNKSSSLGMEKSRWKRDNSSRLVMGELYKISVAKVSIFSSQSISNINTACLEETSMIFSPHRFLWGRSSII